MSTQDIISSVDYLSGLTKQYANLKYDLRTLKPWFAKTKKIFFQCSNMENKDDCLKKVAARQDFEEFIIVSVIKETDDAGKDSYSLDESRFKRLGKETVEAFITRYQKNLQEPVALSMQLFNKQQMEVIGFTYVSPEDIEELMKKL